MNPHQSSLAAHFTAYFRACFTACYRQWFAERALRRRGIDFRSTATDRVESAYRAMSPEEFDAINARQAWANEHVVPSLLAPLLPHRAIVAADLGCGTGVSTQLLARCCPPGSRVYGIDHCRSLLQVAAQRGYRDRCHRRIDVRWLQQSIRDEWRDGDAPIPPATFDVVLSCGVLGHHFDCSTIGPMLQRICSMLSAQGIACLDAGPTLPSDHLVAQMARHGFSVVAERRSCFVDRNRQLTFQRRQ